MEVNQGKQLGSKKTKKNVKETLGEVFDEVLKKGIKQWWERR